MLNSILFEFNWTVCAKNVAKGLPEKNRSNMLHLAKLILGWFPAGSDPMILPPQHDLHIHFRTTSDTLSWKYAIIYNHKMHSVPLAVRAYGMGYDMHAYGVHVYSVRSTADHV